MPSDRLAILFDIDGTLIDTGGAGAASWRLAFDELYDIPADIGEFTDSGMTDPEVGRKTFEAVLRPRARAQGVHPPDGAAPAPPPPDGRGVRGLPGPGRASRSCCPA